MRYLLDSDICIFMIRQRAESIIYRLSQMNPDDVTVSSITVAELMVGVEKSHHPSQNKDALMRFLTPFEIIEFDTHAAIEYGTIRADLERRGNRIGAMDLLIAAIAKAQGMTLVSNNLREFKRVAGLRTENWV